MRIVLLTLGWLGVFGAIARSAIAAYAFWLVNTGKADAGLSAGDHLSQNIPWLSWVIDVANALFPASWMDTAFAWPATWAFSASALLAMIFAWLCFAGARALSR